MRLAVIIVIFFIGLIAILYIISAIYKFLNQSKYIYCPTRQIIATPSDIGLQYDKVILNTADGIKLTGWYIPSIPSAEATLTGTSPQGTMTKEPLTVLVFHGNGGNISHNLEVIEFFYNLGYCVFIVDYRGYGESEGRPTEEGTYLDALCSWEYLVTERKIIPKKIIIYGYSLGGAIACWLAAQKEVHPGALILDSTFTSVDDMASRLYPYLPVRRFLRYHYRTIDYIGSVTCPVLVIHSKTDDYIPYEHGLRLFKKANKPKEFLQTYGGHLDGFTVSREIYLKKIKSFASKYISG
ncbi:MAG: alpha/beta hydrolase [Actinobacteria bacterium]|nr:alpha/beta hydrolase [Actinomycetota bacterium]